MEDYHSPSLTRQRLEHMPGRPFTTVSSTVAAVVTAFSVLAAATSTKATLVPCPFTQSLHL